MKLRFDALTTWRFVAGIHLVVFHEAIRQHWKLPLLLQNVVSAAFMQVTYFFLVSGFVFGITYFGPVERQTLNLRHFWLSRLARLYPVYLLAIAASAPFYIRDLVHQSGAQTAMVPFSANLAAKLTLTHAWFPQIATEWNPPSWAMSAVAFFYLLFPFAARWIVKAGPTTVRNLAIACGVVSVACSLTYCAIAPNGWIGNAFQNQTEWTIFMRLNPAIRLPEFMIGLCLAHLYRSGEFDKLSATSARSWALAGMALLALSAVGSAWIPYMLLHHSLPIVPYVMILVGLARWEALGGASVLRNPRLVQLGRASFSMYILHVPLFLVTGFLSMRYMGQDDGVVNAVVNILLAVVVALLGQPYLEKPSRRWMIRILRLEASR